MSHFASDADQQKALKDLVGVYAAAQSDKLSAAVAIDMATVAAARCANQQLLPGGLARPPDRPLPCCGPRALMPFKGVAVRIIKALVPYKACTGLMIRTAQLA